MLRGFLSRAATVAWVLALSSLSPPARAAGLPGFGSLVDANSLVSNDVVKAIVAMIAFGTQHRPYEPATPLGLVVGLDFSLEATFFKIPDSFFSALSGAGGTSPSVPSLPVAKIHLHKGLGEFFDVGTSFLWLPGNWIVGLDGKIVIVQGEEGPTMALRFCYSYTDLAFSGVAISTKNYSPQFLISRQMEFADPYIGIGFEYATGDINATVDANKVNPSIPAGTVTVPIGPLSAFGYGGFAFGGVSLRIPRSGLRVTIEGSYNTAGTSTLGAKAGFTF